MTTITFKQKVDLPQTNFSTIDEFIKVLITLNPSILTEEKFSREEEEMLSNRMDSTKQNEQEIFSLISH